MPLTLDGFVRSLTDCGLLEADEVQRFIDALPETRRPMSAEEFAKELVKAGRLTKFQAQTVYLGTCEVTQAAYERVMGRNPSWFVLNGGGASWVAGLDTSRFPVENVSWEDATEFCRKLSEMPEERAAKHAYRLPTEAEWEYACRAGTMTAFHFGSRLNGREANCDGGNPYGMSSPGPSLLNTTMVGCYPPNAFGLYDMHGNVREWCQDWYEGIYYKASPLDDPPGPLSDSQRVHRGGGWGVIASRWRSALRDGIVPRYRGTRLGFRAACEMGR